MMKQDEKIASKFLFCVDSRCQLWLGQCKKAKDRSEVDDSVLCVADLFNDIQFNRFLVCLLLTFKLIQNAKGDGSDGKRKEEEEPEVGKNRHKS